ncbi:MAG TPA: hypothetical protein VE309_13985 [Caulobacteraceae bacterium]|jgi:hypothetical protein|nr:hypothetical protein [Caulobacteraceae bacterium]
MRVGVRRPAISRPHAMDREAYQVLEALGRGAHDELEGRERWVEAFKTIRWAVDTDIGPVLTAEGRHARDQLAVE